MPPKTSSPPSPKRWLTTDIAILAWLAILILAVYARALTCAFISYDDPEYVTKNAQMSKGVTGETLLWAFTGTQGANWHPLTTLAHLLDRQIYGLNPAGHHASSVILHAANTLLLFLVLKRLTGARWPSAAVAALFGLHPLHVESVAWVSERKDVLSTFFCLLCMGAYARYVRQPGWRTYLPIIVFYVLGLMAKPMLVTLPFVLLLLDVWPLRRWSPDLRPVPWLLLLEKVPLLLLATVSSVVTWRVQQAWGAFPKGSEYTLGARLSNSVLSYVRYLKKLACPEGLAIHYPFPTSFPVAQTLVACAVLLVISWGAWRVRRTQGALLIGWLWYLGTLVPVIGLVQVGTQSFADRYTYIPSIGIFMMLAWGIAAWYPRPPATKPAIIASAAIVGAVLSLGTWRQLSFWKDDLRLCRHALEVTTDNYLANYILGNVLSAEGKIDEAIKDYREAVRLQPARSDIRNELAELLLKKGDRKGAIAQYSEAVRLNPGVARAQYYYAKAMVAEGRTAEGIQHYEEALRLMPNRLEVLHALAWIRATHPKAEFRDGAAAVQLAERALKVNPDDPEANDTLAAAYAEAKRFPEAMSAAEKAVRLFRAAGDKAASDAAALRLDLYRFDLPFRQ